MYAQSELGERLAELGFSQPEIQPPDRTRYMLCHEDIDVPFWVVDVLPSRSGYQISYRKWEGEFRPQISLRGTYAADGAPRNRDGREILYLLSDDTLYEAPARAAD